MEEDVGRKKDWKLRMKQIRRKKEGKRKKEGGNKDEWKINRRSNKEVKKEKWRGKKEKRDMRKNEWERKEGKERMKEKYEREMFGEGGFIRGENWGKNVLICLKKLTALTV